MSHGPCGILLVKSETLVDAESKALLFDLVSRTAFMAIITMHNH